MTEERENEEGTIPKGPLMFFGTGIGLLVIFYFMGCRWSLIPMALLLFLPVVVGGGGGSSGSSYGGGSCGSSSCGGGGCGGCGGG